MLPEAPTPRRSPLGPGSAAPSPLHVCSAAVLMVLTLLLASRSHGQIPRPGDTRPELPRFEPPPEPLESVLPPLPMPDDTGTQGLDTGDRVEMHDLRFEGNRAIPDAELRAVALPYLGRRVSAAELEALRDALMRAYLERGFRNMEIGFPDQDLADGILTVEVIEGVLSEVRITGLRTYRESIIESRMHPDPDEVVNIHVLEERLQLLRSDPRIETVTAQLIPHARGETILEVDVEESSPWRAALAVSNHQTPGVGEVLGEIDVGHENVLGLGDPLDIGYGASEGSHDIELTYAVPVNRFDTTLLARVRYNQSEIVERPFDDLNIENRNESYALGVRQPLYRTLDRDLSASLIGEWRRNTSWLDGGRFSFVPGPENGVSKVAVLRFGLDASYQGRDQVLALRSTLSWGLDALGATRHGDARPDGQYVAWLAQAQWARRLPFLHSELVARADLQLTTEPLLGLEQFSVGGYATVRGYRENTLVRDNGFVTGVEWRVPIFEYRSLGVELAPFFDYGHAWDDRNVPPTFAPPGQGRVRNQQEHIASAGIGLRARFGNASLVVDWARNLDDTNNPGDDYALQDDGFHIRLRIPLL